MRTLQEIYDFCLLDRTYNAYYDIPDEFACTQRQYRYYHTPVCSRGVSRGGTFIYGQAIKQLYRFLGIHKWEQECIRFFIDSETYEICERNDDNFEATIYLTTRITSKGVRICFTHPFKWNEEVIYIGRSHNEYTEEGVRRDVVNYINKKILFAPGRYRDLQFEYKVPKERFVEWYKTYKRQLQTVHDTDYWEMYEKYNPQLSFEESYSLLAGAGAFYDFGIDDEYEREEMAVEFMRMCNK